MCVIRTFYYQFERNRMLLILVNLEKGKLCQKWPHLTLKWIDLTFSLISWPENKKTESFGQSNDQIRSTYSAWGSNSKIILMIRRWIFFQIGSIFQFWKLHFNTFQKFGSRALTYYWCYQWSFLTKIDDITFFLKSSNSEMRKNFASIPFVPFFFQ